MLPEKLAQAPVAEPYSIDQPLISTATPELLKSSM